MMTLEEARILTSLRNQGTCPISRLDADRPAAWTERALAHLEWLGCVVVFHDRTGEPTSVQITPAGVERLRQEGRLGRARLVS
jgi:hypothetical protein